jgi:hypothetical protein
MFVVATAAATIITLSRTHASWPVRSQHNNPALSAVFLFPPVDIS